MKYIPWRAGVILYAIYSDSSNGPPPVQVAFGETKKKVYRQRMEM